MNELDMGLLMLFIVLTVVNVILNTARTIITVKGGMFWSSFISAIAFGFYVVVIVYTVCELPLWLKAIVTALANFVGTYFVKYIEMKVRKQRLWMVDVVIFKKNLEYAKQFLNKSGIQFSEMPISNSESHVFHIYSNTQDESRRIRDLLKKFNAKYVVVESKSL
jgi:uncharacterized protein YebE (UPF0316 family)